MFMTWMKLIRFLFVFVIVGNWFHVEDFSLFFACIEGLYLA